MFADFSSENEKEREKQRNREKERGKKEREGERRKSLSSRKADVGNSTFRDKLFHVNFPNASVLREK